MNNNKFVFFVLINLFCILGTMSPKDHDTSLDQLLLDFENTLNRPNQEDEGGSLESGETLSAQNLFKQAQEALVNKDFVKAQELLEKVVEREDDESIRTQALLLLGYEIKIVQQGDYDGGMDMLDLAEMNEHAIDQKMKIWKILARRHAEGVSDRDLSIATKYYEKLANQKHDLLVKADAHFQLVLIYDGYNPNYMDSDLALIHLKEVLAQQVNKKLHAHMFYKMYEMAIHGCGPFKQDFDLAVGFLEKAINQQDDLKVRARAYLSLGNLYRGVLKTIASKVDYLKALSYYQWALEQQDDIFVAASACELLAHMYSTGYPGVAVDVSKAIGYMQIIIDKELGLIDQQIRACILLGDLYREGLLGVAVDKEKAKYYYKKAAAYQGRVLIHDASINQRLKWAEDPNGAPKIQNTSDILF